MSAYLMAGGGTGGHVVPLIAVARELRRRGHAPFFVGTREGFEARLAPAENFPIEWIEIGGLKSVGLARSLKTLAQLGGATRRAMACMAERRPAAVFSLGGYVAGPSVLAALARRVPFVLMEPNAMPGFTNRQAGRFAARALVSFPEAQRFFPLGKSELTGLPVRAEFFRVPPVEPSSPLRVLVTGGSRGARTLNQAVRGCWPRLRESGLQVAITLQCGRDAHAELAAEFAAAGLPGAVVPFVEDMPGAFAEADLIVARSGAGAVSELAAAGRPSLLCPFPFATDNHQLKNAEAMERAGAARLVRDQEMTAERLWAELRVFAEAPGRLRAMGEAARGLAKPGAAERAADVLEEVAKS
jgi:UDP-N-acetylglucosamine--N-acetylmuramyl-(pentapeptide) pyrophosphoryl-undecaprenol N-acetylglucosamine transferase